MGRGTSGRGLLPQASLHLVHGRSPAQHTSTLRVQKQQGGDGDPCPGRPGANFGACSGLGKGEQAAWTCAVMGQGSQSAGHWERDAALVLAESLFKGAVGALNTSLSIRTGSAPRPEGIGHLNECSSHSQGARLPALRSCLPDMCQQKTNAHGGLSFQEKTTSCNQLNSWSCS